MDKPTIAQLIEQREALERKIAEAQRAAKLEAVAKVKALMAEHGLTTLDITSPQRAVKDKPKLSVAAKYRDPATGKTWSGRGLKPRWLTAALTDGKRLEDFVISTSTSAG